MWMLWRRQELHRRVRRFRLEVLRLPALRHHLRRALPRRASGPLSDRASRH